MLWRINRRFRAFLDSSDSCLTKAISQPAVRIPPTRTPKASGQLRLTPISLYCWSSCRGFRADSVTARRRLGSTMPPSHCQAPMHRDCNLVHEPGTSPAPHQCAEILTNRHAGDNGPRQNPEWHNLYQSGPIVQRNFATTIVKDTYLGNANPDAISISYVSDISPMAAPTPRISPQRSNDVTAPDTPLHPCQPSLVRPSYGPHPISKSGRREGSSSRDTQPSLRWVTEDYSPGKPSTLKGRRQKLPRHQQGASTTMDAMTRDPVCWPQ